MDTIGEIKGFSPYVPEELNIPEEWRMFAARMPPIVKRSLLADMFSVSQLTVKRKLEAAGVKSVRGFGKGICYHLADVVKFLESQEAANE